MPSLSDLLRPRQENPAALPVALFDPAADQILNPLAKELPASSEQVAERVRVEGYFREYFSFPGRPIEGPGGVPRDPRRDELTYPTGCPAPEHGSWPVPRTCVRLGGNRGNWGARINRLYVADLVWLYYMERMGVFTITGALLDDFAANGRFPIPGDSMPGVVLETMVREMRSGIGSSMRERHTAYRRCLGWSLQTGAQLDLGAVSANRAFDTLFHRFVRGALELYRDRRLSEVINNGAASHRASTATLISVRDTIRLLKKALEPFSYGRNYSIALNGIVWVIGSLTVLRDVRRHIGIPEAYAELDDFVPAAYELLVSRDATYSADVNRFSLHHECATNARNILLDIEVLDEQELTNPQRGGPLEQWIDEIEDNVEGYRTAYRAMTNVDLGPSPARDGAAALQQA